MPTMMQQQYPFSSHVLDLISVMISVILFFISLTFFGKDEMNTFSLTILIHKCPVVKQGKHRGHIFSTTQYIHHWKLWNSPSRKAQSLELLPHVKNVYDSTNQR